jgi:HSP90 family molecular chaperone
VVGASGTAAARVTLMAIDVNLIGRFGIGMLSGFAVGDTITVTSRQTAGSGHRFHCRSNGEYQIDSLPDGQGAPAWIIQSGAQQGTAVRVHVVDTRADKKMSRLTEQLDERIVRYALLLRYPVFNQMKTRRYSLAADKVPWRSRQLAATNASAVLGTFLAQHCRVARPLFAFLVGDPTLRYGGILYIPDDRKFINPTLAVGLYSQGLLVDSALAGVLPPYAVFLDGILEGDGLPPTASREEVIRDESFGRFRASLQQQVVNKLAELAGNTNDLAAICAQHGAELKRYILEERTPVKGDFEQPGGTLLTVLLPHLRFPLARGEDVPLADYRVGMDNRPAPGQRRQIYYSTIATASGYQIDKALVSRGIDVILIQDHEPGKRDSLNLELLHEYAKQLGFEVRPVEDLVGLFEEQTGEQFVLLRVLFEQAATHAVRPPGNRDLAFRVSSLRTQEVPLLMVLPDYDVLRTKLEGENSNLGSSDIESIKRAVDAMPCNAVINVDNPVIQVMVERLRTHPASNALLLMAREVIHLAYVYSGFDFKRMAMNVLRDHHLRVVRMVLEDVPAFDHAYAAVREAESRQ